MYILNAMKSNSRSEERSGLSIYKGSNSIPSDLTGTTPGDERDCSPFSRSG